MLDYRAIAALHAVIETQNFEAAPASYLLPSRPFRSEFSHWRTILASLF